MNHILRWIVLIGAFMFAALVYGVWRELDRELGLGLLSAFVRGAVMFIFLYWIWKATQKWVALPSDEFYREAMTELDESKVDPAIMAKSLEKSGGSPERTRAVYISLRVKDLQAKAHSRAQHEAKREKAEAKARGRTAHVDNIINDDGETALILAARTASVAEVERLLRAGADPNKRDRFNKTAFDKAQDGGHTHIAKLLRNAVDAWEPCALDEPFQ